MNNLVLIDGAGGFLGAYLINEFLSAGFQVRATDVDGAIVENENVEFIPSNLLDKESLAKVVDGVKYVIHAAAAFNLSMSKEDLYRINAIGTQNLCEVCKEKNVEQIVYISTADSYGRLKKIPATEDHPQKPVNKYAWSKLEGEKMLLEFCKRENLNYSILRPSVFYGPKSKYIAALFFAIPQVLSYIGLKRIPYFKIKNQFTLVHVEDVARSASFVCGNQKAYEGIFNVAEDTIITKGEWTNMLLENFNLKPLFYIPVPKFLFNFFFRAVLLLPNILAAGLLNKFLNKKWKKMKQEFGLYENFKPDFVKDFYHYFPGDHSYDCSKIKSLGFQCKYPSFRDEFSNVVKWYRDNKWLP